MKILFITLSNIGDCILSLPVLDALRQRYPQAKITCLASARSQEIFRFNPAIDKVIIFDKQANLKEKIKLFFALSRQRFDLVVDLRNSFFGAFLPAKKKNSSWRVIPSGSKHARARHLFRAGFLTDLAQNQAHGSLVITAQDEQYALEILQRYKLQQNDKLIIVAPGARSQMKRWDKHNFSRLCRELLKEGWQIILAGDNADLGVCNYIQEHGGEKIVNLCAKTTLTQLAALLKRSRLLITNDSAVMHLASYLNVPVAAIFGPTDEVRYAPWSQNSCVIKKDIFCRPCRKALCRFGTLACLSSIKSEDVYSQVKGMLKKEDAAIAKNNPAGIRRILIVRTDRIGDVLLSTPAIKALREQYPQAYISMMVAPYARDIVEGNPYLDEVIIYDKEGKHKSWWRSIKFASRLKKKKFDLAVILHPTNRAHLVTFLSGIPKRLGYRQRLGFLLNLKKEHTKQLGQKHEVEYNLELLKELGIQNPEADLYMPLKPESELWAKDLLDQEGIGGQDKLLALNPGASCLSKLWPIERFAQAAERLAKLYNFKILILAGAKDMHLADKLAQAIKVKVVNLAGKTSVSQLASILKRCALFISNDSGPVHIASAVGTPVISIFGRNQPGLSPLRWGPRGKRDRYLHKKTGCIQCLAHNCKEEFVCLKAITVEDVVKVAEEILALE